MRRNNEDRALHAERLYDFIHGQAASQPFIEVPNLVIFYQESI